MQSIPIYIIDNNGLFAPSRPDTANNAQRPKDYLSVNLEAAKPLQIIQRQFSAIQKPGAGDTYFLCHYVRCFNFDNINILQPLKISKNEVYNLYYVK